MEERIIKAWDKQKRAMGLRRNERKGKGKKMDRKKEWYRERKMTEGRNKKEEWMQREGKGVREEREKIGKGMEER